MARSGRNGTLVLKSTGGSPQAEWSPCISVEFEIEAETVGQLKEKVEDTIGVDVEDWRLFQFGILLPNEPETKLADYRLGKHDGDQEAI